MRKQLQGIGLILFGILLCVGEINFRTYTIFGSLTLFPFTLLGVCVGIIGLVQLFGKGE